MTWQNRVYSTQNSSDWKFGNAQFYGPDALFSPSASSSTIGGLPSPAVYMTGYPAFTVSYAAFNNPLFGASGPSITDVNQGYLGDCYLLAPLAELASQDSSLVNNLISSNGNNTYTVTFHIDGVTQQVTVNNELAVAQGTNSLIFNTTGSSGAIWASLVEKAYAQLGATYAKSGRATNYTGNNDNAGNSWTTIGNGGSPEYALEEITGASKITDYSASVRSWSVTTYNQSLARTQISSMNSLTNVQNILARDLQSGDDLILTSNTNATDSAGNLTLVSSHAMAITGYDATTNMFEIYNPWGTQTTAVTPNGTAQVTPYDTTFEVSLATLYADGDTITADNMGKNSATTAAAPTLAHQTANQTWKSGQTVDLSLANTFSDPSGDPLVYHATLANGSALPNGLTLSATNGLTLVGAAPQEMFTTQLSIAVTATDTVTDLSVQETFNASIAGLIHSGAVFNSTSSAAYNTIVPIQGHANSTSVITAKA